MKLIIMRHGEAVTSGPKDEDRPLTSDGIEQAKLAGVWLKALLAPQNRLQQCLVSPYLRASQTFSAISELFDCSKIEVSGDVLPMSSAQLAHDYIATLAESLSDDCLLVVSHMPFISYLVEEVTVERSSMLFDTSSVVVVDYDPSERAGSIEQVYHPD